MRPIGLLEEVALDVLMLCYRGEALREFALSAPLEIGRGAGCDIVVHDPALRERHYLVAPSGGAVVLHELDGARSQPRILATGQEVPIGRHHSIARLPTIATGPARLSRTEPLESSARGVRRDLTLVIGRGSEARRVALDERPVTLGSGDGADVRLPDRAVSALHCRFETSRDGLRVRDLASRNGTFVDGVAIGLARIDAGASLRVGRTDLRVVAREELRARGGSPIVAGSDAMRAVLGLVDRIARLPWPALVTGESGTGKEVIARALHERGPSAAGPFVAVNAGGLPASLIETELFGHERGAFTGAEHAHRGVFEQASGGTLFLDEIGELPLELQARLLRVLETWEIRRVGAERPVPVKVRLVCATHRDPRAMVAQGAFRQDLYYRIAQLAIHVPPLRERPDDVRALAQHFLRACEADVGRKGFEEAALARLVAHRWPGNARELRNAVHRAAARCAGAWISLEDVAIVLDEMGVDHEIDDEGLRALIAAHDGNLAAAARALGVPRTTLRDRLRPRRP